MPNMLTRASSAGAKSRVEMGVAIKPSAKEIHVTMENPTMFFKNRCLLRSMRLRDNARAPFVC